MFALFMILLGIFFFFLDPVMGLTWFVCLFLYWIASQPHASHRH